LFTIHRTIHSKDLQHTVKLLPVVSSYATIMSLDLPAGVSRVSTQEVGVVNHLP